MSSFFPLKLFLPRVNVYHSVFSLESQMHFIYNEPHLKNESYEI